MHVRKMGLVSSLPRRRTSDPLPPPFPWGDTPEEDYYRLNHVSNQKAFFHSPRGVSLFTQSWHPLDASPRALILMVHGYGNDISWTFQSTAMFFTRMGYASFALDLQGHGRSEGLRGYLPDLDLVAQDCLGFFSCVKATEEHQGLPCFLYGESMGAAICLLLHFMAPHAWNGAILVSPMCKISDAMRPPCLISQLLILLGKFFPTWPVVPSKDLVDKSVKNPKKRELARNNPRRYSGKPRLGTVLELLRVTSHLEERLHDVDLPFLILHGDADVVTDPSVSQALYHCSKSKDKSLKLYKGMQHSLLQGEDDDNVKIILSDISVWLDEHLQSAGKGPIPS